MEVKPVDETLEVTVCFIFPLCLAALKLRQMHISYTILKHEYGDKIKSFSLSQGKDQRNSTVQSFHMKNKREPMTVLKRGLLLRVDHILWLILHSQSSQTQRGHTTSLQHLSTRRQQTRASFTQSRVKRKEERRSRCLSQLSSAECGQGLVVGEV